MVNIYVNLIIKGLKTIDDVPSVIRDSVIEALASKQSTEGGE